MSNRYPGLNIEFEHHFDNERVGMNIYGFWVFLMSDLITFGLFFATYAAMNNEMGQAKGPTPNEIFDLTSIAWQTGILLVSSLTAGLAALAVTSEKRLKRLTLWLILTFILGASFLYMEIRDFVEMWRMGATPMRSGWLSSFYALVGLHGIHIVVGLIWILTLLGLYSTFGYNKRFRMRLLVFVLYWHFLDLIWIGIYTIVFLGGMI